MSLDGGTVASLREHRKRQAAEQLAAGSLWRGDGALVFVTETGDPLYPETPSQLMTKLATRAGLPRVRLHDLRRARDHAVARRGAVHVVANRLGHADPVITLRVYAHVLREQTVGVADVFAAALGASCQQKR